MTGLEAWAVIAPILEVHSVYDAYVVAYVALKEYDEKRKGKK